MLVKQFKNVFTAAAFEPMAINRHGRSNALLRLSRTIIVAQLRRQIFHRTIQIEKTRAAPLPMNLVKYDRI